MKQKQFLSYLFYQNVCGNLVKLLYLMVRTQPSLLQTCRGRTVLAPDRQRQTGSAKLTTPECNIMKIDLIRHYNYPSPIVFDRAY